MNEIEQNKPCRRRTMNRLAVEQKHQEIQIVKPTMDASEYLSKSHVITVEVEDKRFIHCPKCGKKMKSQGIGSHRRVCK